MGSVYALLFPVALVAGWIGQRRMRRLVERQVGDHAMEEEGGLVEQPFGRDAAEHAAGDVDHAGAVAA